MIKWTSELCKFEALKYSRKSDWYRAHQSSYAAAQRNGWFDACVAHMTEGNFSRTKEQCIKAASRFSTRNAFKHGDAKNYSCARREGWLEECCVHMTAVKVRWTLQKCIWVAAKYQHITDWKDNDQSSYNSARLHGWFDECSAHMTDPMKRYTRGECVESARGYIFPSDWRDGDTGAYRAALNNGWFDECSAHMTRRTGPSKSETELFEFVTAITPDAYQSDRELTADGKELDIVIPSKNIAIEFNGLIWHSARFDTPRNYHQAKSDASAKVGLRLIHIWEDEWLNKRQWVEAFLRLQLTGPARKIGARKCTLVGVDTATARTFHDMYHLQGYKAGEHFGVYAGDELVALCTVKNEELVRWTVKFDLVVIGGLSKVTKYIGRALCSFCDTAKHDGIGYRVAGFDIVDEGHVGYWYTDGKQRVNRMQMQKHKLLKMGATGDTEQELAASLGFYQIGGCRQLKFRYNDSSL